jgi:eukaryotic-like serine/threonine-protein kinase
LHALGSEVVAPRLHALGKYRLVAELARGGMGVVYLALMRGPGAFSKLLVLKELKPDLVDDQAVVDMFMQEGRLAACLNHPNVVQTLEAGSDGKRHYIAMEYLDGQSLYRVLSRARRTGQPVPFELQGAILCSVLEGLAYAHGARDYEGNRLGIVHRDVSPHNVFIGYDGQVKVLDFGIAKAVTTSVETKTGILKGKVAYMAPEQAAGGVVDERTDLFSVGVMLWEAATGRRFWSGMGNDMQILRALLRGNLDAVHDRATVELPEDVRAIVARATSFDPAARHASAPLLLEELRAALVRRGRLPSAADLGRFVEERFGDDRARLRAAIEAAMSHGRGPVSGKFSVSSPIVVDAEVPSLSMVFAEPTPSKMPVLWQATSAGSSISAALPSQLESEKPGSRPWVMGAAMGAVLAGALALIAGVVVLRRPSAASVAPTAAAPAPAVALAGAARADDRAPAGVVNVVIRASPSFARIFIDRSLVVENPFVTTMTKDGATHFVHVEAEGYLPQDSSFEASGNATIVLALDPRKTPARWAPVARAPAVTSTSTSAPSSTANVAPPASPALAPVPVGVVPQRRINSNNPYSH